MGSNAQDNSANSELYQPKFRSDWDNYFLYDLADWVNGMAFRNIQFSPAGKPVIKIAEIKNGISGQTKFTEDEYDLAYLISDGDMLFSWSGQPETSIDVFRWRGPTGWLNQHIFRVHPKKECQENYFFYLLKYLNPNFVRIARNKQTTGLGHVTKKDLQAITVRIPSDEKEQRAIAHILGSLDDKIELNRQMNRTLEKMAQAIFKSWFIDFDPVRARRGELQFALNLPPEILNLFPDSFEPACRDGHGAGRDSELGEIPKGWEVKSIGDAVQCVGGATPSTKKAEFWDGGTNPFLTPKDMSSLISPVILDTTRHITDAGVEKISSRRLPVGTVILSSRAPIGYLAISEVPVSVNQGIIAMICNGDLPNHYVLLWTMASMETIKGKAGGTTFAEISKKNFRPIPALIPTPIILDAFTKQVEPLFQQVVENVVSAESLSRIRDTLLPKLISGELPIPDAEKFIEEAGI